MPSLPPTALDSCHVLMVSPASGSVLMVEDAGSLTLPVVRVASSIRNAIQVLTILRREYGVSGIVLDFLSTTLGRVAIVEWLDPSESTSLTAVPPSMIRVAGLDAGVQEALERLFQGAGVSSSPFTRFGWWTEALEWVEQTTQQRVLKSTAIQQLSAGGAFALLQFPMADGGAVWLKATGTPNEHERSVTRLLASLRPLSGDPIGYVPAVLAERPDWNAWLMCGVAKPFPEPPTTFSDTLAVLKHAVRSLAHLQIAAVSEVSSLTEFGAFDQSWRALRDAGPDVFAYVREVMPLQTSTKAPMLPARRINELYDVFRDACDIVERLDLPLSVLHGDLNVGNLVMGEQCQFIDWAEAYVGCPIVSMEHLLLLNRVSDVKERLSLNTWLRRQYADEWERYGACDKEQFERAWCFAPFLAAYSALYGRGHWLTTPEEERLQNQGYAQTLARHMDRAALEMHESRCV